MKLKLVFLAVLVTAVTMVPAYARNKTEIHRELAEARTELSRLRWQTLQGMQEKYLKDHPVYQKLLAAEMETRQIRQNFLDEATRRYPEGQKMISELELLLAKKDALPRNQRQNHENLRYEIAEMERQLDYFQKENNIKSWGNADYRKVTTPYQRAASDRFDKTLELLLADGSREAINFVAEIRSAMKKVEELEKALRDAN